MERNLYIDLVKGIAALSVIFIHTTFFSGLYYVPGNIRTLSLLIDVPIFFLLSGLTSSGKVEKALYRLLKLQVTYMVIITIAFSLAYISKGNFSLITLIQFYFHDYSDPDNFFESIKPLWASLWFMRVYFIITFFGVLSIAFLSRKQVNILLFILLCGIISTSYYRYNSEIISYTFFYLFIFLVGYQYKNISLKTLHTIFGFVGLIIFFTVLYFEGKNILYYLQYYKFPPTIVYLASSSFSLLAILFFKSRVTISKPNFLTYLGKNALFIYFAQGFSSALLYFFVYIGFANSIPWCFRLPIMFLLNVALALIIFFIIKNIDSLVWKGIYKLKRITS